jgi:WD40 repeat protein
MRETKILSVLFRDDINDTHQKGINRLKQHCNSLLTAGRDGVIRKWDLSNLGLECSFRNHMHWVNDIECSESLLFSASSDSRILIWNLQDNNPAPKPADTIFSHKDYIHTIKLSRDTLFSAGEDGYVLKTNLDYRSTKCYASSFSVWSLDCTYNLLGLAFSSKVMHIQIGKIVDIRTHKAEMDLKGHTEFLRKIQLRDNEKEALTCSSDGTVKLWDIGTRKTIENYNIHNASVFAMNCDWDQGFL